MTIDFADPLFLTPAKKSGKKRQGRRGRTYSAPERSARLYVYIDSSRVHMFRFLLEAQDNLGIMTVVDRWRAALLLRFSPHQQKEVREFLEAAGQSLPFSVVRVPESNAPPAAKGG